MIKRKEKIDPVTFVKQVMININSLCKTYQYFLQTVGIFVGLYLLYLTYISVKISNEQLKISQKQEYQKQLPIWEFEIIDSMSIAKLKPFSQDVKLEQAIAYFPDSLFFKKKNDWEIDPPVFNFYLSIFKDYAEKLVMANTNYDDSTFSIALRNNFPVGLELSYVQFGELRSVSAIFSIQYSWVRSSKYEVRIEVSGIKFMRYIMNGETLMHELNQIVKQNYKDFKHPKG